MATQDERAALASRTIPQMTLSTASNPLTAPLPPIASTSAAERALQRFAIEGNAVLTGGAGSLALAAARALLEHGASGICLLDLPATLDSSSAAINILRKDFPSRDIHAISVDITSADVRPDSFRIRPLPPRLHRHPLLFRRHRRLRALPRRPSKPILQSLDVNLTGSFLCAQAAGRYMRASTRGGSILFTASISAHTTNYPQPQAAYNVSKAGVSHLTRNLAAEWANYGIRVNCLAPGYMDTVLNAGDNLQVVRDIWAGRCPMGRMGDVQEIEGAVVMLCSRRAGRYMTGAEVVVDGGALCF